MVARVGEAIKKEMVLEHMEEDRKEEEEVRRRTDRIEGAQTEGRVAVLERNFGEKDRRTKRREELCDYELWLCLDFPLRLIGS